ncbi:MAG: D-Ala-D-Ala carboxypeptidase family metallohydrolase, partial [Verrucomicrobia bacterium]|nr:D-Ala-D-Ala carboxypeptidase family metallohydrolase [Verrucomicrobiota bacterium]
ISPDSNQASESFDSQAIHRRGVLGTLGLAGLGVLASSITATAYPSRRNDGSGPQVSVPTSSPDSFSSPVASSALPDLPEEWAERQGHLASDYLRYLNGLHMQRVCPKQVLETHAKAKASVWNSLPPKAWWNRIGYTLRVVDRIAREMNVAQVEVISAYRCPAYNAHCSGARSGSWHQANIAADVKFPVKASQVTATARELRDLGLFKGGVGGYWDFTHIDCRGQNINW